MAKLSDKQRWAAGRISGKLDQFIERVKWHDLIEVEAAHKRGELTRKPMTREDLLVKCLQKVEEKFGKVRKSKEGNNLTSFERGSIGEPEETTNTKTDNQSAEGISQEEWGKAIRELGQSSRR